MYSKKINKLKLKLSPLCLNPFYFVINECCVDVGMLNDKPAFVGREIGRMV